MIFRSSRLIGGPQSLPRSDAQLDTAIAMLLKVQASLMDIAETIADRGDWTQANKILNDAEKVGFVAVMLPDAISKSS